MGRRTYIILTKVIVGGSNNHGGSVEASMAALHISLVDSNSVLRRTAFALEKSPQSPQELTELLKNFKLEISPLAKMTLVNIGIPSDLNELLKVSQDGLTEPISTALGSAPQAINQSSEKHRSWFCG